MTSANPAASEDLLGQSGGRQLGAEWYTSPTCFEVERERLWRTSWVSVGRAEDLTEPGSFLAATVAGDPIVVVRTRDGELRAMGNVCPHRNATIMDGTGTATALQCPYHNWTFRLDGSLAAAPNMASTGFDSNDICLPAAAVELWSGWVFVNLDTAATPLAEQLVGLDRRIEPYDLASLRRAGSFQQRQPWNWKVTVENFSESYHHAAIHPESLHRTFPGHKSWVEDNKNAPWLWLDHVSTDPDTDPFAVAVVFPSHTFSIIRGLGMVWFNVEPQGVDSTDLTVELFLPEAADADLAEGFLSEVTAINDEDTAINARVRAGLGSRWAAPGPASELERGLVQLRDWIATSLARKPD